MSKRVTSYTCGVSDIPLMGITIGDAFDKTTTQYPDQEALVSRNQNLRYTYAQLQTEVNCCAKGLIRLGFQKGDRIGIWSPNCAEWTILQFATSKTGIILVNINPSYRTNELKYALEQSGCRGIVCAAPFKTSDFPRMVNAVAKELPGLQFCCCLDATPGFLSWCDLMEMGRSVSDDDLRSRQSQLEFDDPINIQYTSGTTGFPKGATLSHHNILNNGFFTGLIMRFSQKERLVIPVPLYHCFGMVLGNLCCIAHGATMIYPSPVFDAKAVLEAIQAEKATALYGVPTMFIAELEYPEFASFDLKSLRTGIMAGAPCPIEVMKKVITQMHMKEVEIGYGMTETSPISFQSRVDSPFAKRVSTVGLIHPHVEVKIVQPQTKAVLPIGQPGELCTRGYNVMLGYWNNETATRNSIDSARWMHTGDLAEMDEEGYVRIVGRIKDMIIRGGENIYPRELEEFLHTHPAIAEVQVIGVPDKKYGEEVMVWIKLRTGFALTPDEVKEFCKDKIAHFKVPRYVKFVDTFPMTVTGKVQKFVMREISVKELSIDA